MKSSSLKWLSLRSWITNNIGSYLLKQEQQQFSKIASNLFGEHFILLGESEFLSCADSCTIKNKIILHSHLINSGNNLKLSSRQDKLAIKCSSVDVVYLAHCLELADNPHEILREAYRILTPEGMIIVTGFNPISIWGIWRLCAQFTNAAPWQARFLGINKLFDWLALLGFNQPLLSRFLYMPPVKNKNILSKFACLESIGQRFSLPFSGAYMLVAKKRMLGLTPVPITFKQCIKPDLVTGGLIETNIPPN